MLSKLQHAQELKRQGPTDDGIVAHGKALHNNDTHQGQAYLIQEGGGVCVPGTGVQLHSAAPNHPSCQQACTLDTTCRLNGRGAKSCCGSTARHRSHLVSNVALVAILQLPTVIFDLRTTPPCQL